MGPCRLISGLRQGAARFVIGTVFGHNLARHRREGRDDGPARRFTEASPKMAETAERTRLEKLESLGDPMQFAGRIHGLITFSPLFETFNLTEIRLLSQFMQVYRDSLARIILEQTTLGAKILMELVLMLSQRLRQTSSGLLAYMDREKT